MATVYVEYTAIVKQSIDWPDEEMHLFNYENLMCNLYPRKATNIEPDDLNIVKVNGENHDF